MPQQGIWAGRKEVLRRKSRNTERTASFGLTLCLPITGRSRQAASGEAEKWVHEKAPWWGYAIIQGDEYRKHSRWSNRNY